MRAVSRTTLTLGELLEIPIGIVPATGSQEVRFDTAFPDGTKRVQQYAHPTKTRTLYELPDHSTLGELAQDDGGGGGVISTELLNPIEVPEVIAEAVKGVRIGDDFRVVPPSELEYAQAATHLETVQLLEFIDYRVVPTDRLTGTFFVQPDPGFARPLRTIMRALRDENAAMLVKWSVKTRQRLGVIRVRKDPDTAKDVLVLNGVVFAADMRKPDAQVLEPATVEVVDQRDADAAVLAARQIIRAHHGTGKALDTAEDDLPGVLTEIVERAHDGLFDDPARVLELASLFRTQDPPLNTRAEHLVAWAELRWPELVAKRVEVEHVIAEGGDDVGEKLAALVG
jgi:non-homologous end joining protein Ku